MASINPTSISQNLQSGSPTLMPADRTPKHQVGVFFEEVSSIKRGFFISRKVTRLYLSTKDANGNSIRLDPVGIKVQRTFWQRFMGVGKAMFSKVFGSKTVVIQRPDGSSYSRVRPISDQFTVNSKSLENFFKRLDPSSQIRHQELSRSRPEDLESRVSKVITDYLRSSFLRDGIRAVNDCLQALEQEKHSIREQRSEAEERLVEAQLRERQAAVDLEEYPGEPTQDIWAKSKQDVDRLEVQYEALSEKADALARGEGVDYAGDLAHSMSQVRALGIGARSSDAAIEQKVQRVAKHLQVNWIKGPEPVVIMAQDAPQGFFNVE